jgi:lambda family phage tail tape measure protein
MSTVGINVAVTQTGAQNVTVQIQNIGQAANNAGVSVDGLNAALSGLGLGAALNELKQYVDGWANVKGMIDVSTSSLNEAAAVTQRVMDIAQNTRQPLSDIAQLYQRMAVQADALGLSQNQVLQITQELGQALVVQHATVAQASGALLQFSQALGTGKVRAQEWNSILTGLPVLAKAVADQLGVATSQVKQMITAGTLTSQQLAQAVLAAQGTLQAEFDKSAHTISQSFTVLNNAVTEYIGKQAEALNATNLFGTAMEALAAHIDTVAKAFGTLLTFTTVFTTFTRIIPALVTAFQAMGAALLANPFAAIAAAVAAALVALYEWRDSITIITNQGITLGDYMRALWNDITTAVTAMWNTVQPYLSMFLGWFTGLGGVISQSWNTAGQMLKDGINAFIGLFVGFYNVVVDLFHNLPDVIISAVVDGVNGAGGALSNFVNSAIAMLNTIGDKVDLHIDPVKFTALQNQFKTASTTIADDLSKALNTDYIGNLTNQAAGYARTRQLAAHQGGGGSANLDLAGTAANLTDNSKAVQKLQEQLRTLLNSIDPAAGALLDMAKDDKILSDALAAHLITGAQYTKYLDEVAAKYKDIINPVGAYIDKLNQETALLNLDGDQREQQSKYLQEELALRQKHHVVTAQEVMDIQATIAANIQANELAQKRNQLITTYIQPQKDFTQGLEAANQLYEKGTLSASQYADAVNSIALAYADTQKTWEGGLAAGLLQIQQDFSNIATTVKSTVVQAFSDMNDALANFVTTGKLNFSSLVDNIVQGFLKIQLQVIESKALSALFGASGFLGSVLGTSGTAAIANTTADPLSSMISMNGWATGGYTGDGGVNEVAGVVHKGEVVIPANVVAQPGMKDYLTALAAGSGTTAAASSVATGGTAASSGATMQMSVVIQNNNADKSSASVQQGTDSSGNPNLTVIINSVEDSLAGRVQSGRGKLHKAIGSAYGLRSSPSRG